MNNASAGENVVLRATNVSKTFADGVLRVEVLRDVSLAVSRGERIAILGRSGSGKSTLLHLLGGLDLPTTGDVLIGDVNLARTNERLRGRLRNEKLGFVYQFHHLLSEFTALENVAMPLLLRGNSARDARELAYAMLEKVGLAQRVEHKPGELSGGERQRAALARALVTTPACLLADEPTGNLDRQTAEHVYQLMLSLNREMGVSLVVVTHDHALADRMDRRLLLEETTLREVV